MRIFVPFTKLRAETMKAVPGATFVPLIGDYAYSEYFQKRWEEGETFINVEHDVVPAPKVLESMWNCGNPVCVAGYVYPTPDVEYKPEITYGGCVKISKEFIQNNPDLWRIPARWSVCDGRITQAIERNPYPGIDGNENHCYHGEVLHLHGC